jgi:hypothetical protein
MTKKLYVVEYNDENDFEWGVQIASSQKEAKDEMKKDLMRIFDLVEAQVNDTFTITEAYEYSKVGKYKINIEEE